jgi:hypothetical protein
MTTGGCAFPWLPDTHAEFVFFRFSVRFLGFSNVVALLPQDGAYIYVLL